MGRLSGSARTMNMFANWICGLLLLACSAGVAQAAEYCGLRVYVRSSEGAPSVTTVLVRDAQTGKVLAERTSEGGVAEFCALDGERVQVVAGSSGCQQAQVLDVRPVWPVEKQIWVTHQDCGHMQGSVLGPDGPACFVHLRVDPVSGELPAGDLRGWIDGRSPRTFDRFRRAWFGLPVKRTASLKIQANGFDDYVTTIQCGTESHLSVRAPLARTRAVQCEGAILTGTVYEAATDAVLVDFPLVLRSVPSGLAAATGKSGHRGDYSFCVSPGRYAIGTGEKNSYDAVPVLSSPLNLQTEGRLDLFIASTVAGYALTARGDVALPSGVRLIEEQFSSGGRSFLLRYTRREANVYRGAPLLLLQSGFLQIRAAGIEVIRNEARKIEEIRASGPIRLAVNGEWLSGAALVIDLRGATARLTLQAGSESSWWAVLDQTLPPE